MEKQTAAATVQSSMELPQKVKNGTVLWPNDSTSGNISKETWNTNSKEYMHSYVIYKRYASSTIYSSQDLKAAQVPIRRWVDKTPAVELHNGILLGCMKEGNCTFCDSVGGPRQYCAKWNKPVEKDKYYRIWLNGWNLI